MSKSKYNPEKHHRRSIRLKGHDYAGGGLYFVTICAHRNAGKIFADEAVKAIVEACWREIPEHFPGVEPGEFVVMPDHVHGIIHMPKMEGAKNLTPIQGRPRGTSRTLGSVVRGFKVGVTKRLRATTNVQDVWHRNYYEMMVRTAEAEKKIAEYIRMNPWRCVQQFGNGLRGMGNPSLWNAEKLGVLCSRNAPRPTSIPQSAVYLSGFHSPLEKEIFIRLLEYKRNIIWCPAWGIDRAAVFPGVREALEENRMLILEMRNRDGDLAAAEQRNRFILENADQLWLPHVNSGGMIDRLMREMKVQGKVIK